MSTLDLLTHDDQRRAGLRKMRIVATSLLILAAIVYVATLPYASTTWVGFVNTGSEAAMVGALADWFAVTAIFRHPLGIKIPHTALIKRRKAELGRSLQSFVVDHFLNESVVEDRLANARVGMVIGTWLQTPANRKRALLISSGLVKTGLERLAPEDVRKLVTESLLPRLREEELSPIAGVFLEGVVADGAHQSVVDLIAREAHGWLKANPDTFNAVIGERAPRWSPSWLDRTVGGWAHGQAVAWLADIRDLHHHPVRQAVDDLLTTLARDMQHDPQVRQRAEDLKSQVLSNPQVDETVLSLWNSIQHSFIAAIDDESSLMWERFDDWLAEFGRRLLTEDQLRGQVEARIAEVATYVARTYGPQLATVISYTVDRWDADEASARIELFVGKDLQFIRINGTVVGALAGLAIHGISLLIA